MTKYYSIYTEQYYNTMEEALEAVRERYRENIADDNDMIITAAIETGIIFDMLEELKKNHSPLIQQAVDSYATSMEGNEEIDEIEVNEI